MGDDKPKDGDKGEGRRIKDLKNNNLIRAITPDCCDGPDLQVFEGLLCENENDGKWRLYVNPDLSKYIEVDEADILHAERGSKKYSAVGLTAVWLRKGAEPVLYDVKSEEVQTVFLKGPVTKKRLPGLLKTDFPDFYQPAALLGCWVSCLITEWTLWSCTQDGHNTCKLEATEEWKCGGDHTAVFEEGDTVHITSANVCQPCTNVRC